MAAPLGVPMALGLTLGVILAVSGGNSTRYDQPPLPATASPSGRIAVDHATVSPSGWATAVPVPSASPTVTTTLAPAAETARPQPASSGG